MDVKQLKKQAKELVAAARAGDAEAVARFGDLPLKLAGAQLVLAREHGYPSWPALVRVEVEQPFHDDIDYYEGRAEGIATVKGISTDDARRELAGRHGYSSWDALKRHVAALSSGAEPAPLFVLAYRALESADRGRLIELVDALVKTLPVPRRPRLSIGISTLAELSPPLNGQELMQDADRRLYAAKFARKTPGPKGHAA